MRALCKEDQELVLDYVKEKIDSMDVKFKEEFYIHNEIKVKEESSTPLKRPLEESYAPPLKRARYDDDEFDDVLEVPEQMSEIQGYQELQFPHSDETTTVLESYAPPLKKSQL